MNLPCSAARVAALLAVCTAATQAQGSLTYTHAVSGKVEVVQGPDGPRVFVGATEVLGPDAAGLLRHPELRGQPVWLARPTALQRLGTKTPPAGKERTRGLLFPRKLSEGVVATRDGLSARADGRQIAARGPVTSLLERLQAGETTSIRGFDYRDPPFGLELDPALEGVFVSGVAISQQAQDAVGAPSAWVTHYGDDVVGFQRAPQEPVVGRRRTAFDSLLRGAPLFDAAPTRRVRGTLTRGRRLGSELTLRAENGERFSFSGALQDPRTSLGELAAAVGREVEVELVPGARGRATLLSSPSLHTERAQGRLEGTTFVLDDGTRLPLSLPGAEALGRPEALRRGRLLEALDGQPVTLALTTIRRDGVDEAWVAQGAWSRSGLFTGLERSGELVAPDGTRAPRDSVSFDPRSELGEKLLTGMLDVLKRQTAEKLEDFLQSK
ncbi:MAG: hypothetical protein R3F62_09295 [Planctomycetota bacterium]